MLQESFRPLRIKTIVINEQIFVLFSVIDLVLNSHGNQEKINGLYERTDVRKKNV